jgi:hypothetical protein
LKQKIDEWVSRAETQSGAELGYQEKRDGKTVGLLKMPGLDAWDLFTAPNSLRNVEPGVNLALREPAGRRRG